MMTRVLVSAALCVAAMLPAQTARPNVVLIILDDAGFADIGAFGSEIHTPTMDALAAGGLRYTQMHTTGLCSPSRAALLTGRNHHTVGMRTIANFATDAINNRGRITPEAATLAELLRDSGYNTFAVGKWHLVPLHETTAAGPFDNWPLGKGFERYYGFLDGGTNMWLPELVQDNHQIDPPSRDGYHLTEDLIDRAIGFVRDQQSARPDKPFFLYLSLAAPHAPHQAPPEYLAKYRGRYDAGWDVIRQRRFQKMRGSGIIPAGTSLAPRNAGVAPWDSLDADSRRLFARYMEAYAGYVDHSDAQLGRLVSFLRAAGALDNTLLVLLSDNGASQEGGLVGTTNIVAHANGIVAGTAAALDEIDEIGNHAHANYPQGWAQVSNTPFQRYKQNVHFGGVRDPMIVHWPAGIRDRGGIRAQFHHLIDITPTVLELTRVEAPATYRGVTQLPVAGVSLAYTFDSASAKSRRTTQYFEMYGHRGLYHDGWKAVTLHVQGTPFAQDRWELYHVAEDFSETRNLASEQAAKLRELVALWEREAERFGVHPLDDRTRELRRAPKVGAPADRRSFTFHQHSAYINTNAAPDTKNRSYRIAVDIDRAADRDGVLIAHGDRTGGFTLYVANQRLVHEYNYLGRVTRVESDAPIPSGKSIVEYVFTKTGNLEGRGTLRINGRDAGSATLTATLPNVLSFEGMSFGRDALSPVSSRYPPRKEFPFTGIITRIQIELGDR